MCKLLFPFPYSLNLYILGLRATKILLRSMLCFVLFSFSCNHIVLVSEGKINLYFYKHNAVTRIDSSSNFMIFYVYYFGSYDTLRKGFDQKNNVALHTKLDLNLHLMKKTSRTVNLLDNQIVIGLLKTKVFLKHNINVFINIFFMQLVLPLFKLY